LADVAIKGALGTPATWQKAHEREQEARRRWESGLPGRAEGGPVEEERPYLVGEKGPEVFVPEQRGTILPNKPLSLADVAPRQNTPAAGTPNLADAALNEIARRQEVNAKPPDLAAAARSMGSQRDTQVPGAPHILQNPEGATFARTYLPEQGGSMAWNVPVQKPQTISGQDLLTPENISRANAYLKSVGAYELDDLFVKSNPDAARGMVLDALNKSGIRSGGATYQATPDLAAAAQAGVQRYAASLAPSRASTPASPPGSTEQGREPDLSRLVPRPSAPASPTELLRGQTTTTAPTAPAGERESGGLSLLDLIPPRRRRYGEAAANW
jgi:hypothetical protein